MNTVTIIILTITLILAATIAWVAGVAFAYLVLIPLIDRIGKTKICTRRQKNIIREMKKPPPTFPGLTEASE